MIFFKSGFISKIFSKIQINKDMNKKIRENIYSDFFVFNKRAHNYVEKQAIKPFSMKC